LTTQSPQEHADITALSFEDALRELEGIVKRMETGEAALESAITDYARGMALKGHCEKKLADARMKVEKVVEGEGGAKNTESFDPDA
jgi:exodeoxyribonuclease VII small subunit